jgi:glycosyltransferase involved in cell wall biosynthesis
MPARPVRVAIVLNTFEVGGTEHQMTELIRRLDSSRFDIHVACLDDRGPLRHRVAPSAPITAFPFHGFASAGAVRQAWRFARWCRRRGIDVVHSCDFYANVFALPAAALARVPVRIGSRRDVSIPERSAAKERLQRTAYRAAHRVIANSAAAVQRLVDEGVPAARISCVENGIDVERHRPRPRPAAGRVVATVANLRPGKGHETLLRAAALVAGRMPDVRFDIAGDGPLRTELEATAHGLGLSERVRFLGHVSDVPAVLHAAGAFAFPSRMEAAPNALIEAMAAALPVVASAAGGIPEVVVHERNGLLVPPGDPDALAAALLRLFSEPALAARLSLAAHTTVASRFSFDRMVGAFEAIYLQELGRRDSRAAQAIRPSDGSALA